MSDESVQAALRSDVDLVVIEAPAGCGKTHQGADYARDIVTNDGSGRLLILTHTHAACSVFADRTRGAGSRIEIRTIDGLIAQIASAYHAGLGLPPDPAAWVRQRSDGYAQLAVKVAILLKRYPMITASLAQRYPFVICDEHQDASGDQHSVIMALHAQGCRLRLFSDPMQKIFRDKAFVGSSPPYNWNELVAAAGAFETLDRPHRWSSGSPELGQWTLLARDALKAGGRIDLRSRLPSSVTVVRAENQAWQNLAYQLSATERKPIDRFERSQSSLLVLTRHNETARSLRPFFNRRIPLWEGHIRVGLERLVDELNAGAGRRDHIARAVVTFIGDVGKGFSRAAFGNRFEKEVHDGCVDACRGKPAAIQDLARFIVESPDHRGAASMLRRLTELKDSHAGFAEIEIDCHKEFWDAVRLGEFATVDAGLTEITHRRTYSRPKPPEKAISTIHKAKGLECESVIIMPCDASTFPNKPDARCLLYVALSRAKNGLMLVVSTANPSPLLEL